MTGRDLTGIDPSDTSIGFSEFFAEHVSANDAKPLPKLSKPVHPHTQLVKQTVDALKRLPGNKIVRKRPVGRFIAADGAGNPRKIPGKGWQYVRVAVAGDADIELVYLPPSRDARKDGPLVVYLECKTGNAVLSEDQKDARDQALACGCVHIVVRSAAQAFQDVLDAAKGGGRLL